MKHLKEILTNICKRVRLVLDNDLQNESDDFRRGYRYAYNMFLIGAEKDKTELTETLNTYNLNELVKQLENNSKIKDKKISELQDKIVSLKDLDTSVVVKKDTFIHIQRCLVKEVGIDGGVFMEIVKRYINI